MFCRMVNLFDGFPTLILLKVSSSLLPVLITQKLVANADSQGATGISTWRNHMEVQIQSQIQIQIQNKKNINAKTSDWVYDNRSSKYAYNWT